MRIPYNKPYLGEEEIAAASQALREGRIGGGSKSSTLEAEELLARLTGAPYVFLTTSATHALELALLALEIGPGDEVICPSFGFVTTATAIVQRMAKPIFADISEETLNIDVDDVARKITPRTRAVIPIHYAGVGCDMEALVQLGLRHGFAVIEDAAQGMGARWGGRHLGTIGEAGCISFHETKNITCGEGGAYITKSGDLAREAEIIREKGTNRAAFFREEVDKYTWVGLGSSYVISDILAAVLVEQLMKLDEITKRRRAIFQFYMDQLKGIEDRGALRLPKIPAACEPNGHIFYFLISDGRSHDGCLQELKKKGVQATSHYVPLHSSPYGRDVLGYRPEDLPVTEQVSSALVRLPIYPELSQRQLDYVVELVWEVFS